MGIVQSLLGIFKGYNWLVIPAALLSIVVHEVSHGYAAYLLGDRTAKNQGRLTLNPIPHIDPLGLLSMIIFRFGWAKPVPVNPYYFKNRKLGMVLVSLAGPLSNMIFAIVSLLLLRVLYLIPANTMLAINTLNLFMRFFTFTALLNVGLAVFNLIPVPPLDGSKILFALLPNRMYGFVLQYERYGIIILILLIYLPFFSSFLSGAIQFVFNLLYSFAFIGF